MSYRKTTKKLNTIILALFVAACGGGGGDDDEGSETSNDESGTLTLPDFMSRVNVDSKGNEADQASPDPGEERVLQPAIDTDGRFVAFTSWATNLVPNDNNAQSDIFVHDRLTGETSRVSIDSNGDEGSDFSQGPAISADGRYVAFTSSSSLTPTAIGSNNVYVHDRVSGKTTHINVDAGGNGGNINSARPSISADGRFVSFSSAANNLIAGDTNSGWDIFVHDRDADNDGIFDEAGAIGVVRVSVSSAGAEGSGATDGRIPFSDISADGRHVTFSHYFTNLVAGDGNALRDIFVHDRDVDADGVFDEAGAISTTRISVSSTFVQADGQSLNPRINANGRFVVFESAAKNLESSPDFGSSNDAYVHDRDADEDGIFDETHAGAIATVRVSVDSAGARNNGAAIFPDISDDGRYVTYESNSTNLVADDINAVLDVFIHDRDADDDGIFDETNAISTTRISLADDGSESDMSSHIPAISGNGRYIAFRSIATNLVDGDNNSAMDVFVDIAP